MCLIISLLKIYYVTSASKGYHLSLIFTKFYVLDVIISI